MLPDFSTTGRSGIRSCSRQRNLLLLVFLPPMLLAAPHARADVEPPHPFPPQILLAGKGDFAKMVFVLYRVDPKQEAKGRDFPADPGSAFTVNVDTAMDLPGTGVYLVVAVPGELAARAKNGPDPVWLEPSTPGVIRLAEPLNIPNVYQPIVIRYELASRDDGPKLTLQNFGELKRAMVAYQFSGSIPIPQPPPTVSMPLAAGQALLLMAVLAIGAFLVWWLVKQTASTRPARVSDPADAPAEGHQTHNGTASHARVKVRRELAAICGILVAFAVVLVPPWQDWAIPPYGSGYSFAGFSPFLWPPHNPWTVPFLAPRPFWNDQHEYRIDRFVLLMEVLVVGLIAMAVFVGPLRRSEAGTILSESFPSLAGACLGGVGTLVLGVFGVMALMAPLLEAFPHARVAATLLMLVGYLAAIVAGCMAGARLRIGRTARVLAGAAVAQLVVAYFAFVMLPDKSSESHRLLLLVWEVATLLGVALGVTWARRTGPVPVVGTIDPANNLVKSR